MSEQLTVFCINCKQEIDGANCSSCLDKSEAQKSKQEPAENFIARFDGVPIEAEKFIDDFAANIAGGPLCDSEKVKAALSRIYARIGLPVPLIMFAESPIQYAVFPYLLQAIMIDERKIDKKTLLADIKKQLASDMKIPLIKRLWSQFNDQLKDHPCLAASEKGVGANLSDRLCRYLWNVFSPPMADRVEARLGPTSKAAVEIRARQRLGRSSDRLRNAMENLRRPPSKTLFRALNALSRPKQEGALATNSFRNSWGNWDCHWLVSYAAVAQLHPDIFTAAQMDELGDWLLILKNAFSFLFMENACFVLNSPKLSLDENERLHHGEGPALTFADGQKLYAWHGSSIPEWVITRRRFINPILIDLTENAEVRRVLIEIYGWQKYLRSFGTKVFHEDKYGKLYRREPKSLGQFDEPLMAVEVVNSTAEPDGSYKRYLLRVPPSMQRAKQAVAWTFGLREEDYDPEKES